MADKKNPKQSKQNLSEELVQRVRAGILRGDVGYGRPPKEHQFKKGDGSPNPGGRPRKAAPDLTLAEQPFLKAVSKSIDSAMTIKENGVARQTSSREALVESVKVSAIGKLNARSQGLLADWTRQADEAKARDIRENNEFWSAYQQVVRDAIAEVKARGEPEPEILYHPDDIITDREGYLRHIGPFDEISRAATEKNIALRQSWLMQGGLDERLMPKSADGDFKGPGTAFEFAKFVNRSLPPRLRMDEFRMLCRIDFYSRHPLRWLLKMVFDTWRKAGLNRKRGELSPPLGEGLKLLRLQNTFVEGILDGTLSEISEEQMEELILENRRFASQQGWV